MTKKSKFFENVHVLEAANNHWGDPERAHTLVSELADVVEEEQVDAVLKLQFRDMDSFIHRDFKSLGSNCKVSELKGTRRYVQKTQRTVMSQDGYADIIKFASKRGLKTIATAFDEKSVQTCVDLGLPAIKIASADIGDINLLTAAAETGLPIAISTGGANTKMVEAAMDLLRSFGTDIAINHCVSRYPSEPHELQLNQLNVLKKKYPEATLGFSSHEYQDPCASTLMSYALGARTWERHVDIPYPEGHEQEVVSPYCLTPDKVRLWFKAYKQAKKMCGPDNQQWREVSGAEKSYLFALRRGVYFKRDVMPGETLFMSDVYFAVPWHEGVHLHSGGFAGGRMIASKLCRAHEPVKLTDIDTQNGVFKEWSNRTEYSNAAVTNTLPES